MEDLTWYQPHDFTISEAEMDAVCMALYDWLEQNPPWDALNEDEEFAINRVERVAMKLRYRLEALDRW